MTSTNIIQTSYRTQTILNHSKKTLIIIAFLFCIYYLFIATSPRIISDGSARYCLTKSLTNNLFHSLKSDCGNGTKYPLLQPILAIPLYKISQLAHFDLVKYFNLIIILLFALYCYSKNIFRLNNEAYNDKTTTQLALLFILSTSMLLINAKTFYGETLSSLLILLGIFSSRNNKNLSIVLLFLGCISLPVFILPASIFLLFIQYNSTQEKNKIKKAILSGFLFVTVFLFFFFGEIYLKFKSIHSPYLIEIGKKNILPMQYPGFNQPILLGIINILFSTGKGLVFFCTPFFLILSNDFRLFIKRKLGVNITYGLILFTVSITLIYSKWWGWYGGLFYGPRFFLLTSLTSSIFLILYAKYISTKKFFLINLILYVILLNYSSWIFINGYIHSVYTIPPLCLSYVPKYQHPYYFEPLCWHVTEYSNLFYPFIIGNPLSKIWHAAFSFNDTIFAMRARVGVLLWLLVNTTFLRMLFIEKFKGRSFNIINFLSHKTSKIN